MEDATFVHVQKYTQKAVNYQSAEWSSGGNTNEQMGLTPEPLPTAVCSHPLNLLDWL